MIELTVKTLDSQNHQFSVEDDITVEQFKVKIAEKVNVPPETQRIIYCGRVLQDSSKLADYDVNGKVVHLVQRAPPGSTPRPTSRSASPQPQRRGFRGLEQGNAMYLGSMAFPSNLMESQGIVPPPPTHSLSGSRLNVAKRMLRRAEAAIRLLENPSSRPQEHTPPEENQEEEVTPVIEARVIVPANNSEPIDEAMVLNAVQNSLMSATTGAIPLAETANNEASGSGTQSNTENTQTSPDQSGSSTPGRGTPRSSSTENLTSQSRSENSSGLPENASRTAKMAELLTMLGQLQTRFAPFLARYQTFMQDDPEVPENASQTQTMLNRVSEVLHFLGHAYHSLSDILIRVRTPPPRPLLCRPILIQQSAVVQTGIPIQVEAQINLSADRPPTTNANQTTTENSGGTNATPNSNANASTTSGGPTISVQPGFVGLPFLPGAAMRVQSFPVEIRAMRSAAAPPRPQNNNNNTVNSSSGSTGSTQPTNGPAPSTGATNSQQNGHSVNFNNPNVEFFMEVTPEGITIDSLETTLVGSNQANDFLRGALNGPPPEFLQSLMQMAGQIINGNATTTTPSTTSADSAQSTQQSNTTQAAPTAAGQNSQARGNTQTNPTTATYTLPTPRPHVHLAQQAMQGGFDPFLPCNSHHIARRVYPGHVATGPTAANQQNANQNNSARQEGPSGGRGMPGQNQNILNFINGIFDSISTEYRRANESAAQATPASNTASAPAGDQATNSNTTPTSNVPNLPSFASFFSNLQTGGNLSDLIRQGPTLDQLLQEFNHSAQTVRGGSIITDFLQLLCRNLTLVDLFALTNGNVEPINRNRTEIQNFFRTRVCDGDIMLTGVNGGVERIITELQPFLEHFRTVAVYRDIDLVRSVEQVFRHRLPSIINIAINLNNANSVRLLFDQCITTVKHVCDLILNSCIDDASGLDGVYERLRHQFVQNIPEELRSWTTRTCDFYYRQVMTHVNAPESTLQAYIIRRSESSNASSGHRNDGGDTNVHNINPTEEIEAMDTTNIMPFSKDLRPATTILADTEPLPNIVLGSDPWHSQVPEDWVPIIARDAQKQRRQNPQGPFSDAYLSGMPNKRRKIVNSSKPQGSLPQVISDSVRQAVTATGLGSAASLEVVSQAAGASSEIQAAYRSLLRTSVQDSLRDNEDFTPERFPNASNYFNNTQ